MVIPESTILSSLLLSSSLVFFCSLYLQKTSPDLSRSPQFPKENPLPKAVQKPVQIPSPKVSFFLYSLFSFTPFVFLKAPPKT